MKDEKQVDEKQPNQPKQELAIITQLVYGYTDQGVGMVFNIQLLSGGTTLFMEASAVTQMLIDAKVANIVSLQGKPCAVNVTGNKQVSFDRLI